jgi:hypothetical protein
MFILLIWYLYKSIIFDVVKDCNIMYKYLRLFLIGYLIIIKYKIFASFFILPKCILFFDSPLAFK